MKKKIFAVAAIAAAVSLAGSSAAFADEYPSDVVCVASPASIAPGATSTITCSSETGFIPGEVTGVFATSGPGVVDGTTLSSIVLASADGSASVTKTSSTDGVFTATFTAPTVTETTDYTVTLSPEDGDVVGSTTITVAVDDAAAGGEGGEDGLPATGGAAPMAAIWLGVGAVGIGGIAVAAAVARRRSAGNN
ncbi:hypothetical protein [Microbacterium sp. C7(2022)]|uniref:hypothetical protein n=1 Tax=Microbacterium sp. C7(2022) TaxID=2992759 RepID=UPI00237A8B9B|nr:hypothetical protein [Microbacterium sp. C7(2022)]MDE0545405.1 hypothetical protein [Microbacterium sp. C7(2022)]